MIQTDAFVARKRPTVAAREFYLGLDCGQAKDFSALCVLERHGDRYHAVHLERLPLDMPYPAQIEHIVQIWHRRPLSDANKVIAIDFTGVGRPVVDLAQDRGLRPVGITITGGTSVSWSEDRSRAGVPKRDLVSLMQIFAQNDRLKVAAGLRFGPVLARELQAFRVKIDPRTAHDSYGAWRENEHDDLLLSVSIALWVAENRNAPTHATLRYISHIR